MSLKNTRLLKKNMEFYFLNMIEQIFNCDQL